MSTIVNYIKEPAVFGPETLSVMGVAYECALKALPPSLPKDVREDIAALIIRGARTGERDPNKLCQIALSTLRVEPGQ
jgi:hypothetical protein